MQPWGQDGDKRRYWLVEGQNDTHFRIYRESNVHPPIPRTKKEKVKPEKYEWFSVAGDIDALRVVAHKLEEEDGRKEAKTLGERMLNAIPRFEASEAVRNPPTSWDFAELAQKRKRREYKIARKDRFTEPVYALYEGRTRGKRQRYTYSEEDEDADSDNATSRPSAEPVYPLYDRSTRAKRARYTCLDDEDLDSDSIGTRRSGRTSGRATPVTVMPSGDAPAVVPSGLASMSRPGSRGSTE